MSIGSLVVDLVMKTGSFETDTKRASKQAEKFAKDIDRQISTAARAIAAAGAAAAVGLAAMVKSSIDSMDHLVDLREQLGLSTETLSQLGYAAKLSGSDLDELVKGLNVLAKNAATAARGSGAAADAFSAIGVSVKNADGSLKSTDQLLSDVADAFSKYEDGAGKAAVAQEIFGKSGVSLIPFLNQGSAGIKELREEADKFGATIRDDAADAAAKFNDNLDKLHAGFTGIGNQIAQKVLPALTAITDRFVDAAKNGDGLNEAVDQIVAGLKVLASAGIVVKTVFEAVGKTIGTMAGFLSNLDLKPRDFLSPLSLMSALARNAKDSIDDLKAGFSDIGSSIKGNIETLSSVWTEPKDKIEEVTVSVERLKKALSFGGQQSALQEVKVTASKIEDSPMQKFYEELNALTQTSTEKAVSAYREQLAALEFLYDQGLVDAKQYNERLAEIQSDTLGLDEVEITVKKVKETYERATTELNEFQKQAARNTQDIIADSLTNGFKDGADGILKSFGEMIKQLIAQAVAADLAKRLFGSSATGNSADGSGWIGAALSLIGGARATGGPVDGGMLYRVNEREPEFFKPNVGGKVVPLSKMGGSMGGMSVTNNISVEAPNGRMSMETQQQMLTKISLAMMSAQRRNG